jgi:flagellar protein FlbD
MIQLHRIGHDAVSFHLNPDLILSIDAHPDTVITLTTGDRFVVAESADEVTATVNRWRSGLMHSALEAIGAAQAQGAGRVVDLRERT